MLELNLNPRKNPTAKIGFKKKWVSQTQCLSLSISRKA